MPKHETYSSVLGFDFGKTHIGVATGQTLTGTAAGLTIIRAKNGSPNWDQVGVLMQQWQPDLIIVGLPLNMDDSESILSNSARRFARKLQGRFGIHAKMVDERLTSREAKMASHNSGHRTTKKVDHIAAALILQSWLDNPALGLDPVLESSL